MTSLPQCPLEKLLYIRANAKVRGAASGSDHLRELLTRMHAPEHLAGVYKVARNSVALFDIALSNIELQDDVRARIQISRGELAWVKSNLRKIVKRLSDDVTKRKPMLKCISGNPLIWRGATKHGLWCLLWHDHPDSSLATIFRHLELKALLAHVAALDYWSGRDEWKPDKHPQTTLLRALYRETLAIRNFVEPDTRDKYKEILSQLLEMKATVQTISGALTKIANQFVPQKDQAPSPIFRAICSMLCLFGREQHPERVRTVEFKFSTEVFVHERPPELPQESDEYTLNRSPMDDADDLDEPGDIPVETEEPDSNSAPRGLETYVRYRWSEEELQLCRAAALHPAEVLPISRGHLSNRRSGPRGEQNWRARDNQLLHWSLEYLPLEKAADTLEILSGAAHAGGPDQLELFALALVVFRTGVTLAAANGIVVCSERPQDVQCITLVLPPDRTAAVEWIYPSLPIQFRGAPSHFEGCRECVPDFPLPDYDVVGPLTRRLLDQQAGGTWDMQPVQPFRRDKQEYAAALRACLEGDGSDERKHLASYCTFERLSKVRFRRIYELAHENVVLATYATLCTHDTGEVPRYYETPAVRTIQQLDRKCTIELFRELRGVGFCWPIDQSAEPSDSHGYVGSPYCPTVEAIKEFLASLRKRLTETNEKFAITGEQSLLILRHKLYVTYVQVGYLIGTCHRAVLGAYADLSEIEQSSRLVSIVDKGPRGRLVPICDCLWTQMLALHRYNSAPKEDGHRPQTTELPIFLLALDLSIIEIRESTLELPWPMNFGRHFVRTEFAEAILNGEGDITIEYLKELLGHAADGEERDGAYSTFNYLRYSDAMRKILEKLLAKIEYWPIDATGKRMPIRDSSYVRALKP